MKSLLSFQNAAASDFLIVGLGNPGTTYEKTRHNVGFRAVRSFAKRHSILLKKGHRKADEAGKGRVGPAIVHLLLPQTYMNRSGESISKALKKFKMKLDHVAIIIDDIALPMGMVRFKEKGSAGGHNGLKSIEQCLGTRDYPRIRIGIGHPQERDLSDFVLSNFSSEEEKKLPEVFNHTADVLECWISQGIQAAMHLANTKKS